MNNGCGNEMPTIQKIFEPIVQIIAYGGAAAAFSYAIFRFLGKKWIENRFDERLKHYGHELEKELERFKYEMKSRFNGVTRIRDKEFEILPQAWEKMDEALYSISTFASPPKEVPNLDDMEEPELNEFILRSPLTELEKQRLIEENHKLEYYKGQMVRYDFEDVTNAISEFRNYITKNDPFLSRGLREKFREICKIMREVLEERKTDQSLDASKLRQRIGKRIRDDLNPITEDIWELIQDTLRFRGTQ